MCAPAGYKLTELPEPAGEDFAKAVSVLLPYLLSHRTRLAASLPPPGAPASSTDSVADGAPTISGGGPPDGAAAGAQQARPAETAGSGMAGAAQAGARAEGDAGAAAAEASGMSAEQGALLAEAVDTAILKVRCPVCASERAMAIPQLRKAMPWST